MSVELQEIANIPAHIFGAESFIASQASGSTVASAAQVQVWFGVAIFIVVALYLTWINHWSIRGANHRRLFRLFSYLRSDYHIQLGDISPSFNLYSYLGSVGGVLALWIAALAILLPVKLEIGLLVLGGVVLLFLYQIFAPYLIAVVVEDLGVAKMMQHQKAICFSMFGIVVIPTALCYSLTDGVMNHVFMYIVAIQAVAIYLLFIYKTFTFFLTKKVSLLHTILYLCAVEIFPITLVWGFFFR